MTKLILILLASLVAAPALASLAASPTPLLSCDYPDGTYNIPDEPAFKEIALTFDDGPNPETTPHVLDVLKKYKITATFFLIGENIAGNEAIVRRILREGHNIGNHSFTHPHLVQMSEDEVRREFVKTDELLRQFPNKRARVMRFPFGETNCSTEHIVKKMHYNIVGWNIDSCDWSFQDGLPEDSPEGVCIQTKELRDRYRNDYTGWLELQLKESSGGIILMHDDRPFTASHLEGLIQGWIKEGYHFIALDRGAYPELIHDHTRWRSK